MVLSKCPSFCSRTNWLKCHPMYISATDRIIWAGGRPLGSRLEVIVLGIDEHEEPGVDVFRHGGPDLHPEFFPSLPTSHLPGTGVVIHLVEHLFAGLEVLGVELKKHGTDWKNATRLRITALDIIRIAKGLVNLMNTSTHNTNFYSLEKGKLA